MPTKLSWIKRFISNNDSSWKILPKTFFKCNDLNVYYGAKHKLLHKEKIPNFYSDIHNHHMKDFKKTPKNLIQILKQSLWLNENLKINNKHLYNKQFIDKGILYVIVISEDFPVYEALHQIGQRSCPIRCNVSYQGKSSDLSDLSLIAHLLKL